MGYWPVALEGEGSNCFSITQLGQLGDSRTEKAITKLANASWKNIYLGIKQKKASHSIAPISLLEDYY